MGDGYKVVPQALRGAQQPFDEAAHTWADLNKDLDGWRLAEGDMGLIGRQTGIIDLYNGAVAEVQRELSAGATIFQDASTNLDLVAKKYEAQEQAYYEQFGYTEANLYGVSQPHD
ncbi:hypothetical protein [Actinophytocola sp.]|uniref:hypothetical protein n=1 Tax=Actinophytocola sp. TaxID=1872138 RepID=UPI00389A177E